MSWWCFPFEHLIGTPQKINTNDHIGGMMEATIIKAVTHSANICHWLHQPDCPESVRQLKPMKGPRHAHAKWDSVNFSCYSMHASNTTIIYRPSQTERPIRGQIQDIISISTSNEFTVQLCVRHFECLSKLLYDPFVHYPYLLATTYSSELQEKVDAINLDDIVAHAAHFNYSLDRTVLVNLSRD
ncbi:hypothetical protein GYMLUDRAFT_77481 [Collybiopsis luxurians FD-317 M1]|uniref:Unplaced genomic scaffold GYMLUscaffold_82, whole genome shotgun sequence n=1 Tax=Collybiopsis luxurians FD-317 M1 TaxID=944289 RepID=A0A0D0BUX7_9AGAR|nr:hypothetical protein GYMLUDRAFT_77481 [Collybiopsis luxurians FD-317 M1]